MKIAVTGANGFIGKYVVEELERRSISPIIISRPSSIIPSTFLKHVVIPIELGHPSDHVCKLIGMADAVIHLAWGGLPHYKSLHHFEGELLIQYRFLKKLIESGLKNVVIAGTCAEYGMQSGCLTEILRTQPNSPYSLAKDTLRRQLEFLQKEIFFNLTWARLFYLYGEGQSEHSLWMQLKKVIEKGDKVFNMSQGEQQRDYLPVTEAAKYLVSLAIKNQNHGIVNISSGKPVFIRHLVEGWIHENQWSVQLNLGYYPYLDYEPMAFWGCCKKLHGLI